MSDRACIADRLTAIAAELRREQEAIEPDAWIAAFRTGEILSVDQAAFISGTSGETVRRRCEQSAATDRPLGVRLAAAWLVSKTRLLDMIEGERSLHDRLVAEARARQQSAKLRDASVPNVARATA